MFRKMVLAGAVLMIAGSAGAQTTGAWSSVTDVNGLLTVTSGAAVPPTSWGLHAAFNNTGVSNQTAFVTDITPSVEGRYRARFYFNANSVDPGQAQGHKRIQMMLAQQDATNFRLVAIVLRQATAGGPYNILARTRLDDGPGTRVDFNSSGIAVGSGWHWVEFDWQRATSAVANDGRFTVWLDGTQFGQSTTLNNYYTGGGVDFARLGAMKLETSANGTMDLDEFESRRQTMIGALP